MMSGYIRDTSSPYRTESLPPNDPTWTQNWNDVLFLHWPVSAELVKSLIPSALAPDIFEGSAWISIVAFSMRDVGHSFLPVPRFLSQYHELNVRTYVTNGNYSGVYFLSIEAGHLLGAPLSRWMSGMPYRFGKIDRQSGVFTATSHGGLNHFKCIYTPGKPLNKNCAALWFTERYALFRSKAGSLVRQEIDHCEWPLFELETSLTRVDMPQFGLSNQPPVYSAYSPGVRAYIWDPVQLKSPALNFQP